MQINRFLNLANKHKDKLSIKLAHSGGYDKKKDITFPDQPYEDHVVNVVQLSLQRVKSMTGIDPKLRELLAYVVRRAAEFHDMGKLDPLFQLSLHGVLKSIGIHKTIMNHVDAGVAYLVSTGKLLDELAALLVLAHHKPLSNLIGPNSLQHSMPRFREYDPSDGRLSPDDQVARTDEMLESYVAEHNNLVHLEPIEYPKDDILHIKHSNFIRFALSCLVSADHDDTGDHYGNPRGTNSPPIQHKERLTQLDAYVLSLSNDSDRSKLRSEFYKVHRHSDIEDGIVCCDGIVGSGKTTALMAYALKQCDGAMRRIFWVSPFTTLIDQTFKRLCDALKLPSDWTPPDFILAHHHKCDYSGVRRYQSVRWNAEIIIVTAVQFFESLFSNHPCGVKKINQVPGSAIVIDEYDTSIPVHLWPATFRMMQELVENWGCKFILGSGTAPKFWELEDFGLDGSLVPNLNVSKTHGALAAYEINRIQYESIAGQINKEYLVHRILDAKGSRLVIMNTVQNAAVIARMLANQVGQYNVVHLSIAMAPLDREAAIAKIIDRQDDPNLIVVGTMCIQCGMDFDLQVGFRERSSHSDLLQAGGRENRNGRYPVCIMYDFVLDKNDPYINENLSFSNGAAVLEELFDENMVGPEHVTEAMRRELNLKGMPQKAHDLVQAENECRFADVNRDFRVIDAFNQTVIVDPDIVHRLEAGEKVCYTEIIQGSVQMWTSKKYMQHLEEINLPEVDTCDDEPMYRWAGEYNGFLGFMAGILNAMDAGEEGGVL